MPAQLSGLHEWLRPNADWCLKVAAHYGVPVDVTSTLRPWEEQQRLRERWERAGRPPSCIKTATGLVCPANRPGDSAHQYGLAWDSVVAPRYQAWWNMVRRLAGFDVLANDEIHAELPQWRRYVS